MHTSDAILFSFLKECGTQDTAHARGTLYDHLIGTYTLLLSWECPEEVCRAGLFHSIYGTSVFRTKTLQYEDRTKVRFLIGEGAENLVFLFSHIRRPRGLLEALSTGTSVNFLTNTREAIAKDTLEQLITIEAANLLEQRGSLGVLEKILQKVNAGDIQMPPSARQSIQAVLATQSL